MPEFHGKQEGKRSNWRRINITGRMGERDMLWKSCRRQGKYVLRHVNVKDELVINTQE